MPSDSAEELIVKGSSARSGPPPDPNALRRDRGSDVAWITLPSAGRLGDPPVWPLHAPNARELHFWALFWRKPQATEWERLGMEIEVAVYVRRLVEVEKPDAPISAGTLVKQLGEQLGLTIPGMKMHRWKIGLTAVPKTEDEKPKEKARPSSRDRFRVVDGAAG